MRNLTSNIVGERKYLFYEPLLSCELDLRVQYTSSTYELDRIQPKPIRVLDHDNKYRNKV